MLSARSRVIREQAALRGYNHLQSLYGSKSPKYVSDDDDTPILKKPDRCLLATKDLYTIASRLNDATTILNACVSLLKDYAVSMHKRRQMACNINKLILPLHERASASIRDAARDSAPIAGCADYHKKCEGKRKKEAREELAKKNSNGGIIEAILISQYLTSTTIPNVRKTPPTSKEITPRMVRRRISSITPPTKAMDKDKAMENDDITIPLPSNGTTMQYTRQEAMQILSHTKFKMQKRMATMMKMVRVGWAPTSVKTLQRLLKIHESGGLVLNEPWGGVGRKPAMTEEDRNKLVGQWRRGEAHGEDCIEKAIVRSKEDLIRESGGVPIVVEKSFGRTCITNCRNALANHAGVSLVNKACAKTKHRLVSERSKRRTACLLGLVGSSHQFSIPDEDLDIRAELKDLPENIRVMYDVATEARGTAVYPVKPSNLWSIDDTVCYTFAGLSQLTNKTKLVTKESVRVTFAFSAVGTCMPAVVCVSGLTEHELPGTDFLVLEVPGLCIGGGSNIQNKNLGYVLFMRNTEGAKQKKFKWYQNTIFVPGVNQNRKEFDDVDVSLNTEISVQDTDIAYCDRDIPQMKAIVEDLDLYSENGIIFNKHSAASSRAEQAADRSPIFRIIKQALPKHTVRNIPPERCPIKLLVHRAFQSNKLFRLKLSHTKLEALIDFIAVFPGILSLACTPDNCQAGFIKNGMIDAVSKRYPSFNGMFSTCKANPSIKEYTDILDLTGDLISQFDAHGEADEDFLDLCKIPRDVGPRGDEIMRDASIRSEHLLRARCLNHSAIVEKRSAEARKCRLARLNKMEVANDKHTEKVDANREAVFKLLKRAQEQGYLEDGARLSDEENLEVCTLDTFDVLKAPELKIFIIAHDDNLQQVSKIPNRGKLKEAKEGADTSIAMAFNCRMKPNLLEGKQPHSADDIALCAEREDTEVLEGHEQEASTVRLGHFEEVLPSKLLQSPMWRANAVRLFNLNRRAGEMNVDPADSVSEDKAAKADHLVKILRLRFRIFLKNRIAQKTRRAHWSMDFAYNNLPVVAAMMILSGHLKDDIESLNEMNCLLIPDLSSFVKCAVDPTNEGAYLYFDMNRRVFARSGKVVGRGYDKRDGEQVLASKASTPSSTFYRLYPSNESSQAKKRGRKGHFESLVQVVAAGFDATSEHIKYVDRDWKDGGVLILNRNEKASIKSSMKNLNCSDTVKFRHMLAYQMELGYDLALSPDDNVSSNPGFESVLGVLIG